MFPPAKVSGVLAAAAGAITPRPNVAAAWFQVSSPELEDRASARVSREGIQTRWGPQVLAAARASATWSLSPRRAESNGQVRILWRVR